MVMDRGDGIDVKTIVENALKNNVNIINDIGTTLKEFDKTLQFTKNFECVYASLGIHPTEIDELVSIDVLKKYILQDKVIGVGECGLDYHYDGYDKVKQKQNFEIHIELARQTNKPLIIHSRDADIDMIDILKSEMKNGEFKFLLHSFTSGKELFNTGLDLDGYFSLSGIITFKNAEEVRNIVKDVPLNKLLVETDAPFLAPVPYRGKTNQPSYVRNTAEYLADFFKKDFMEFQSMTTGNFLKLFSMDV
jgi:TatD DNase family protein